MQPHGFAKAALLGFTSLPFLARGFHEIMTEPVFKKIEVVGTSTQSFADAAAQGIAKAGESLSEMSWFEVVEMRGSIVGGKIHQYQTTIRIGYRA